MNGIYLAQGILEDESESNESWWISDIHHHLIHNKLLECMPLKIECFFLSMIMRNFLMCVTNKLFQKTMKPEEMGVIELLESDDGSPLVIHVQRFWRPPNYQILILE